MWFVVLTSVVSSELFRLFMRMFFFLLPVGIAHLDDTSLQSLWVSLSLCVYMYVIYTYILNLRAHISPMIRLYVTI